MTVFLGIDPGKSGGIAAHVEGVYRVQLMKLHELTEAETYSWLAGVLASSFHTEHSDDAYAVIEKVSSSPQMGVVSAFTFGRGYGFLRGLLIAHGIAFIEITPQKWQKAMGCLSKGDKNVTKARAQQLYPQEKITHATADALLIATYCRQNHAQLF